MPLYEFICRKCGHVFEELLTQGEAAAAKVACPACGAKAVDKGFSSFATGGSSAGSADSGCGRGRFT